MSQQSFSVDYSARASPAEAMPVPILLILDPEPGALDPKMLN